MSPIYKRKPEKSNVPILICINILDMVVLRLNRGVSITKALEDVSNIFGDSVSNGLAKTNSTKPLTLEDFTEYDSKHVQMFAMFVECIRCTKGLPAHVISDVFTLLKNDIMAHIYLGENINTLPLGKPSNVQDEALHEYVMKVIERVLPQR